MSKITMLCIRILLVTGYDNPQEAYTFDLVGARPVEKDRLSDDDLAVIVGIRKDGLGAQVRQVLGKRNDPPSSEAVDLMEMDNFIPQGRFVYEENGAGKRMLRDVGLTSQA